MQKFLKYNRKYKSKSKVKYINWEFAPDVKKKLRQLTASLKINWVSPSRVFCLRSSNAKTRAIARIWGLSKVWQKVLTVKPAYIIEVISEKYDRLSEIEKDKVILHEITHIPKNFSGALAPHFRRGKRSFHKKLEVLVAQYINNLK